MECLSPVYLRKDAMYVPCGKCLICRGKLKAQWELRLQYEALEWPTSIFSTFTYNDLELPMLMRVPRNKIMRLRDIRFGVPNNVVGSLYPDDVTLFLKRLRRAITGYTLRYYLVGEYGTETFRPHYHLHLFSDYPFQKECQWARDLCSDHCFACSRQCLIRFIRQEWYYGHVVSYASEPGSISYVTSCHIFGTETPEGSLPSYHRMSRMPGIGSHWFSDRARWNYDNKIAAFTYTPQGQKVGTPRYYRDKLFTLPERNALLSPQQPTSSGQGCSENFKYNYDKKSYLKKGKL